MSERPQNKHLKRGGSPGRPKGLPNRKTLEIQALAKGMIESAEYRASLFQRLVEGKAPHMETLLFHYAYGKPVDRIQLVGPVVSEVNRLAEVYGVTAAEILAEAEAIAQGTAA